MKSFSSFLPRALFPCGDHMVCIIDDREDVWNFAPNLIMVKPYKYFSGTDDVNDPFKANKDNKEGKTTTNGTTTTNEENATKDDDNKEKTKNGNTSDEEEKKVEDGESKTEGAKGNICACVIFLLPFSTSLLSQGLLLVLFSNSFNPF